jgi:DNA-binding winged helix-turn-helix (wHTH) protein
MRFLFGDYALDLERRELRRGAELVEVEPQVFDLSAYLVENRDRVASKDDLLAAVWHGRIVSESTLTSRITAARQAIGDSGEQQRFIRTVSRRGFRFVGEVREQSAASSAGTRDHKPAHEKPAQEKPAQEVSFCRTSEGINLAVAVCGKGLPVVKAANWMNHVEFDWQSPVWSPLLTRLAAQFRLIRYDERGTGLSDWNVADLSFETFVRDLETVADALDLRRFALFGNAQGAAVAIAYAVRHPERVSRLVLSGGYAQGWRARGNPAEIEGRKALLFGSAGGRTTPPSGRSLPRS